MSRQLATKSYLDTGEVTGKFGWSRDSLYRFHRRGLIQPHKFLGDKKTYWDTSQLESLQEAVFERSNSASTSKLDPPIAGEVFPFKSARMKPLQKKPRENSAGEGAVEADLEILQVWLNDYSSLNRAEKEKIWQIATRKQPASLDFENIRPEEPDFTDKLLEDWMRERPEIDENLFALFGRLERAGRSFDRDVERSLSVHGLKESEFVVLAALRRIGPPYALTPTDLFKSLLITSGTITKRLVRLENRHLIERRPDPEDGRGTRVYLTPEGKELVDRAVASPGREPYKWLQKVLTPLERKLFVRMLRKMLRARESEHYS